MKGQFALAEEGNRSAPATRPASESVLVEHRGPVARLVINRPPLNILDLETLGEINAKLGIALHAPGVRLLQIRGAGGKAFSAGTHVRDHLPERAPEMLEKFHALIRAILYSPCPTLAVVRGHCLGGGMELALACDFILAATNARFGQPEIELGGFPPVAAILLPRLTAGKKALEVILTGKPISAEEARRLGVVNHVVAARDLEPKVEKFSSALLAQSSTVLALARRAARLGLWEGLESALRESERIYLDELLPTEDAVEGCRAYLEKRQPVWRRK